MEEHNINELSVSLIREDFSEFASLTKDINPLHTDKNFSLRHGFKDTPAQGALLHAYFEKCLLNNRLEPKILFNI